MMPFAENIPHLWYMVVGVIKDDCCTEMFSGNGNFKSMTNGRTDGPVY